MNFDRGNRCMREAPACGAQSGSYSQSGYQFELHGKGVSRMHRFGPAVRIYGILLWFRGRLRRMEPGSYGTTCDLGGK